MIFFCQNIRLVLIFLIGALLLFSMPVVAFNCPSVGTIPTTECNALIDLYNNTDGPNWNDEDIPSDSNKKKWMTNDTDPCEWVGVICDGGGVIELNRNNRNLKGKIPAQLEDLAFLTNLDLSDNKLEGFIPVELENLSYLETLNLSNNQLEAIDKDFITNSQLKKLDLSKNKLMGSINPDWGNTKITELDLSSNKFSGEIDPKFIDNLSSNLTLTKLNLSKNRLIGSISTSDDWIGSLHPDWGKAAALKVLDLSGNQFSGEIDPAFISNLSSKPTLEELNLSKNQLDGFIDPAWGSVKLETLNLSGNQFTGTIPPELGKATELITLNLSNNQLSGSIPPELGKATELITLNLSNNQLVDPIPIDFINHLAALTEIEKLDLSYNQLTGSIPPELGNLKTLTKLNLQENQLNGPIPVTFENLIDLEGLYLRANPIGGSIPPQLGELENLKFLSLQRSELSGSIPPTFRNLTRLRQLSFMANHLSGPIPNWLGELGCLEGIGLGSNQLSGRIPEKLLTDLAKDNRSCDLWPSGKPKPFKRLELDYNQLTGDIPPQLKELNSINVLDLKYNGFTASDDELIAFLDNNDPGWETTQTIPPSSVEAITLSTNSLQLNWTPIPYTEDNGHYQASCGTSAGGPYSITAFTKDKAATHIQITGLLSNTIYYCVVQTLTQKHNSPEPDKALPFLQQNVLLSVKSSEVSMRTKSLVQPLPSTFSLSVSFQGLGQGRVQSDPRGIDCQHDDDKCTSAYSTGTQVKLTPIAAPGSEFFAWGDHEDCSDGELLMTRSYVCKAYFKLLPKMLTVKVVGHGQVLSDPNGIDCDNEDNACGHRFEGGKPIILKAIPAPGWVFKGWESPCDEQGKITLSSDQSCTATFAPAPNYSDIHFSSDQYRVVENEGVVTITVTRESSNAAFDERRLEYLTKDDTAQAGRDYQPSQGTLTWAVGETGDKTFRVTILDNDQVDGDRTLILHLGAQSAQLTIVDDDTSSSPSSSPTTPSQYLLTVAPEGQGTITSVSNQNQNSFVAPKPKINCGSECQASYVEGTSVKLVATPAPGWHWEQWLGDCDSEGHVIIQQDQSCIAQFVRDQAGQLHFSQSNYSVSEGVGKVQISVTRSNGSDGLITVNLTTQNNNSALADEDYETRQVTLTWADGDSTAKSLPVTIYDDTLAEPTEKFELQLSNPTGGAVIKNDRVLVNIKDNDALSPTIITSPGEESTCSTNYYNFQNENCNAKGTTLLSGVTVSENSSISNATLGGQVENRGLISNATIQADATVTGGTLTGAVTNHGTVADIDFRGAVLKGGTLSGKITNNSKVDGIIRDATVAPDSHLSGGKIGGKIINHGTITDVEFNGTQLKGGMLAGNIKITSGGLVQDASFEANTHLSGGKLQGDLQGDRDKPALLEQVIIFPNSNLDNVILGRDVQVAELVTYGPNVQWLEEPQVISDTVITENLPVVQGKILENITTGPKERLSNVTLTGTILNLGEISDMTLRDADSRLTGGGLTGKVTNFGTLVDIEFRGTELMGGQLEGELKNQGIIRDAKLGPNTSLTGGYLSGNIEGDHDFPSRLNSVTITAGSQVSNVIVGHQVINEGTLKNVDFQGTVLEGGTLAGDITNTWGGTIKDVHLAANTHLSGGNLQEKISGDTSAPAYLENVTIVAGSVLEHVILGDSVILADDVTLGPGVQKMDSSAEKPSVDSPIQYVAMEVIQTEIDSKTPNLIFNKIKKAPKSPRFTSQIRTREGWQPNHAMLSYLEAEQVKLSTTLKVAAEHVAQAAELLIVARYSSYFVRDKNHWLPWDENFDHLTAVQTYSQLPKRLKISIVDSIDLSEMPGEYTVYVGYRLNANKNIIFNGIEPIHFFVESAPPPCMVYAVHDEKQNDTQFLKIDLSGGLDGDMEPLGPLHEGYNIEGVTLHPSDSNILYGTAGRDARVDGQDVSGYLYRIERPTGQVSRIGPTGFNQVAGLAVNLVDQTLWGWAKNKKNQWNGIIKIDPETGTGLPMKQFDYNKYHIAGLAWSIDGQRLYASGGTNLWIYDPQTQTLDVACKNIADGEVEGLDMQPNGLLLLGVDHPRETSIIGYDPETCQEVVKRVFINQEYPDIESVVWPVKECNNESWLEKN